MKTGAEVEVMLPQVKRMLGAVENHWKLEEARKYCALEPFKGSWPC